MATVSKNNKIREMAGTEVKISISLGAVGGVTMDDYDFECMFYPYVNRSELRKKHVTLGKADMIRVDSDNYVAVIDTSVLGPGEIMVQVTRHLPDLDCDDDIRTEIACVGTGIVMY